MNPSASDSNNKRKTSGYLEKWACALGSFASRNSKVVLGCILLVTLGLLPYLARVEYDDDILKFLPEDSSAVQQFQEIGNRFQGLSIALLGVEVSDGDLFTVERMRALRSLTEGLRTVEGVAFSSSITEIQDVAITETELGEEMTVVSDLVGELPRSQGDPKASVWMSQLRQKVLSRNHIRGALISEQGDAALVLCYLQPDVALKDAADAIRKQAETILGGLGNPFTVHYGGSPFVGSYIVHSTRRDIVRLSLLSSFAIILILFATARSFAGALIALGAVGIGIVWIVGLMGLLGQPLTLVSSSLPMLLLALGSAYSIHILVRVFKHLDDGNKSRQQATIEAVKEVGPPIFIAGLTSALAFWSFLAMDIEPMRHFGVWMFVGTMVIVFLALTVVPAACTLFPLRVRSGGRTPRWALHGMTATARGVTNRPVLAIITLAAVISAALLFSGEGKRYMTMRDFFLEGSEPVLAEDFLESQLGGSVFMQIQVSGDIKHPLVLRQIDRIAAIAGSQTGVTSIQSVVDPMVIASEALHGEAKIPSAVETTRAIAALTEGDPNLRVIVDEKWQHALIHVKLKSAYTESALTMIDLLAGSVGDDVRGERVGVFRSALTPELTAFELDEVKKHLIRIYQRAGKNEVDSVALHLALTKAPPVKRAQGLFEGIKKELRVIIEEDELVYLAAGKTIEDLARPVSELLANSALSFDVENLMPLVLKVASDEDKSDLEGLRESVAYMVEVIGGNQAAGSVLFRQEELAKLLPESKRAVYASALGRAAGVLLDPYAALPAKLAEGLDSDAISGKANVDFDVTGSPVVYEGMNTSVQRNQQMSLAISSVLVFLALAWFFKSMTLALIASVPAAFTLLVTFGLMGFLNIPMDVGTSMMTSIAIGIGIDYAVHFLWHHGIPAQSDADDAMVESMNATGWGIVINALEVAVGFGLLALGTIVPMRNVGILTACAMVVSAASTLILLPALARWVTPFLRRSTPV